MCYNDQLDEILCSQMSGFWKGSGMNICEFPLQYNQIECQRNGNTFTECKSLAIDECESNSFLSCYLSNATDLCDTKDKCEQNGLGWCTDSEYFVNYVKSPATNGTCVVPFLVDPTDRNRKYCYLKTSPLSIG